MSIKHFQIQSPVFDAFANQYDTLPNTANRTQAPPKKSTNKYSKESTVITLLWCTTRPPKH